MFLLLPHIHGPDSSKRYRHPFNQSNIGRKTDEEEMAVMSPKHKRQCKVSWCCPLGPWQVRCYSGWSPRWPNLVAGLCSWFSGQLGFNTTPAVPHLPTMPSWNSPPRPPSHLSSPNYVFSLLLLDSLPNIFCIVMARKGDLLPLKDSRKKVVAIWQKQPHIKRWRTYK